MSGLGAGLALLSAILNTWYRYMEEKGKLSRFGGRFAGYAIGNTMAEKQDGANDFSDRYHMPNGDIRNV